MMFRQVMVSIVSSATLLSSGMNLGFSAVALPHMLDPHGPDKLTVDQGSWFASISFISTLLGCLTCGPLLDKIGRKKTLIVVNSPFILGWLLLWLAPKPAPIELLYIARLLNGLGGGMISIPANIYIAEMATNSMRCMLISWPSIAISVGILMVYALGLVISSWRTVAAISTFVPIITAISIFFYVRESPFWLITRGADDMAEESFRWIRGVSPEQLMPKDLKTEFEIMIKNSRKLKGSLKKIAPSDTEDPRLHDPFRPQFEPGYGANGNANGKGMVGMEIEEASNKSAWKKLKETGSSLTRPDVWKPLVILNSYFFFMQFSGVSVVIAYAVNIMMSEGVSLDAYFATLLIGIVKLVAEIGAGFVQNRYGRRPLSMGSGLGMAACMAAMGLHHQLMAGVDDPEKKMLLSWIPLILMFAYVTSAAMGLCLLPWCMLGEVYPTKVVGLACGITTCLGNLFGFASIKLFPTLVVLFGGTAIGNSIIATEGVFYTYGAITLVAVIFIFIYLPETFGRTLQEISDGFMRPKRRKLFKCCSNSYDI